MWKFGEKYKGRNIYLQNEFLTLSQIGNAGISNDSIGEKRNQT